MSTCEYPPRAPGRPRMNSSASRTSSQRGKSASSVTSSPNGPHAPRYFTDVEGMLTKSIEEQMINQARPPFKADGTARRTSATRRADAGMGWGSSSRDSSQRDSVVELIRKRKNHIADEVLAPIHNLIGVSDYFKTRPAFYRCSSGDESGLSAENYGGVHQRPPQRPGRNAHTLRGSARGRARTTPYNGAPKSKKQQDAYSTDADSEQFFDTNADMELLAQIKQRELKKAARPNVSTAASKGKPPKPRRAVPVNPPPSKQSEVEEMVFDGSQSSFVLSPKSRQCEGCRVAHVWRGSDGKLRLARSASAEPRERSRSASPSSRSPRKQINRIKHILRNVRRRVNHADEKLRQRSDQVFIQTLLEELARYDVSKEALLAYLTEGVKERDHEDVVADKSPAAPPSFLKRIREEAMMEEKQDKPVSGPKKRSSSDSSSSTSWMSADDDHEVKPERDPKRNAQDKKKKHSRGKKAGSSRSSARSNLVDAATSPMGEKDAPNMVASYASPNEWETQEAQPEPTGVVRVHKREAYDLGQRGALMMLEIKERHEISNEEQLLRQSMEIVDAAEREVPPRRRVSLADPHIQSVVEGQRLDSEEPPLPEVVAQPDPTEEEAEILSDDEASARRGIARAEECIALELQHNVLVFEETFLRRDVEEKEDADRSAVVDQCVGETVDALAERASRSSDVARSPSRTTEVSQSESRRSGRKKRPERRMYFVPTNIVDIGDLDEEAGEILDETTSLLLPSSKPTTADNTVDRGSSISNSRAHNSSKVVYFSNNSGIVDPVDGPRSRSSTPHKQDSVVMYFAPASEKLDEHASTPDPDRASPNVEEEQQEKPSLHLSQSSPGASSRTPSSPRDSAGVAEDLSEPAHIDYTAEMEAREAGHSATEAPVSVDDSSRGHSGQRVDEVANASARSRETITSGGGPSTSRTVPMEHAEDGMAHMDHVEQHRTPPSAGEKSPALSSVPEDPLGSFQSRSGAGDWMIAN